MVAPQNTLPKPTQISIKNEMTSPKPAKPATSQQQQQVKPNMAAPTRPYMGNVQENIPPSSSSQASTHSNLIITQQPQQAQNPIIEAPEMKAEVTSQPSNRNLIITQPQQTQQMIKSEKAAEVSSSHASNCNLIPQPQTHQIPMLRAPEMAAEVSIHSQESSPIPSPEPQEPELDIEDFEVDVETCDVVTDNEACVPRPVQDEAFIPGIPTVRGSATPRGHHHHLHTPPMAAEISVRSSSCDQDLQSQDSSTDDDSSQMSGSYDTNDAEIITLLTLLKKGPNFNPACPTQGQSTELAKQQLEGLANAVRQRVEMSAAGDQRTPGSGISSSLLAVIEQLRERTNSTSEGGAGDVPVCK